MPRIIGLTGGIASGKTSVSQIWSAAGATIIDADAIAREVVVRGRPALWLIRRHFGEEVIQEDGTLNRAALGRLIFEHPKARGALNRRIHPFIIFNMLSRLAISVFWQWQAVIVLDTPLLYESRTLLPVCSSVVVVSCSNEQQLSRLMSRDGVGKGISEDDARKRISSQMPLEDKASRADVVIDNSGRKEDLEAKALEVLEDLKPSEAGELAFRTLVSVVSVRFLFRILRAVSGHSGQ